VLALTLVRRSTSGEFEILSGVRTPDANRTHQEVVSVPTLRVPASTAERWLTALDSPLGPVPDITREVTNLLARKLGVADPLELGQIRLEIHKVGAWQGTSVIGEADDSPVTEDLTMFNACVEVVAGGGLFPTRTASYDPLLWSPICDFVRMIETRDVGLLRPDLDELMYCAYGLCLQTTARVLDDAGLS
jgi:hypothetical protein